jgi:hypothetical protein
VQEKIVRIICKKLGILPFPHKYIFCLLNFILNDLEYFLAKQNVYSVNIWNEYNLRRQFASLCFFKKSV